MKLEGEIIEVEGKNYIEVDINDVRYDHDAELEDLVKNIIPFHTQALEKAQARVEELAVRDEKIKNVKKVEVKTIISKLEADVENIKG